MRKILIATVLWFVMSASFAAAQSEGEAIVTGEVESTLGLVNLDADWGVFSPGLTYVITPSGFKQPPGPGEGAGFTVGAVGFEVDGNAGSEVLVNLVLPSSMLSDDENGSLPMSNWTYAWNYDNDPSVSFAESGPVSGSGVVMRISGSGASGLFLGASITVPTTAFAGSYTAQIIGSVSYTGN